MSLKVRKYGSKQDVWDGKATMTKGKLKKPDLIIGSKNKVVSRKRHFIGKERIGNLRRTKKATPQPKGEMKQTSESQQPEVLPILKDKPKVMSKQLKR